MPKKIVKKTKVKLVNLLLVLLVLAGLFFAVYFILQIRVQNIIVKNTNYLNDDYVLELAGIKNYPKFLLTNNFTVEKRLKSSKYISKAKLHRKLPFTFVLDIKENKPLFYDTNKNKFVLENNESVKDEEISHNFRVPRLLNYVPDKKYVKFIEGMGKIKDDTLVRISDIEYQPNEYDKDRFLLYMDDGNMVYLTLTKFKMINHYNEVLKQLDNHKGILYLDNGNHFKIME